MIHRPESLVIVPVNFEFNGRPIKLLEIDLDHINQGSSPKKRSDFNAEDVSELCEQLYEGKRMKPSGEQTFGDEVCQYFKVEGRLKRKAVRMVVCHCTDKPETLGVITLYRVKENKNG